MDCHKCQQVSETTTTVTSSLLYVCKSKSFLLRTLQGLPFFLYSSDRGIWQFPIKEHFMTYMPIQILHCHKHFHPHHQFFWIVIQRKGRAISSPNITGTTDVTWCIISELEGGGSMQLPTHGLFVHVLQKWLKWSWFRYVSICLSYYFNIGVTTENETSNTV